MVRAGTLVAARVARELRIVTMATRVAQKRAHARRAGRVASCTLLAALGLTLALGGAVTQRLLDGSRRLSSILSLASVLAEQRLRLLEARSGVLAGAI